jgi:formiminotetrahydrofolate cyclodeaminase
VEAVTSYGPAVVGGLIGAAVSIGVSLIAFVYGYGRLSERVDALKESVEGLTEQLETTRKEIVASIDKMGNDLVGLRERVAKLEGPSRTSAP